MSASMSTDDPHGLRTILQTKKKCVPKLSQRSITIIVLNALQDNISDGFLSGTEYVQFSQIFVPDLIFNYIVPAL